MLGVELRSDEFLTELWGHKPPGSVLVWRLQNRRSRWLRSFKTAPAEPGEPDVYTGVGLAHRAYGPHRRAPRAEIIGIPGLWADIDWRAPALGRGDEYPTIDGAFETAYLLAQPTVLVYSGYGFQAWWLFDQPWRFRTYGEQRLAMRASAQWQALLRQRCGHPLDYTHDLARVLRLPHTTNTKRPHKPAPVAVVERGPRHERDDLLEIALQAGEINVGYSLNGDHTVAALRQPVDYDVQIAETMMMRSSMFARTWRHERPELPSMSESDMALGSITALAGGSDQQIADVITAHRAYYGSVKGQRMDYLSRTIAKIRSGGHP
jgi:putative DNA primase/helicase